VTIKVDHRTAVAGNMVTVCAVSAAHSLLQMLSAYIVRDRGSQSDPRLALAVPARLQILQTHTYMFFAESVVVQHTTDIVIAGAGQPASAERPSTVNQRGCLPSHENDHQSFFFFLALPAGQLKSPNRPHIELPPTHVPSGANSSPLMSRNRCLMFELGGAPPGAQTRWLP